MITEISKNKLSSLLRLKLKKNRDEENLFIAEGIKCVLDTAALFNGHCLLGTTDALNCIPQETLSKFEAIHSATKSQLAKISTLSTPPNIIAIFKKNEEKLPHMPLCKDNLYIVLDGIQDPGNLGTIIRTADWFGVDTIFASPDTVDIYNSKTIQATMGSLARVKIHYLPLLELFANNPEIPVYGTVLDGSNIYNTTLTNGGFLCMGNEGRGLRLETRERITMPLYIPPYPTNRQHAESLNVAIATAVALSQFRYGKKDY